MVVARCISCGQFIRSKHRRGRPNMLCSPECKSAQKRRWQRRKIHTDQDYRINQQAAQKKWREQHKNYWKKYRKRHKAYADRNRALQKGRNERRKKNNSNLNTLPDKSDVIAKMDENSSQLDATPKIMTGRYLLRPLGTMIAKMEEITVQLIALNGT